MSRRATSVENNPPRFKHEAGVSSVVYGPPPSLFATATTPLDAGIFLPCCAEASDRNQRGSSLTHEAGPLIGGSLLPSCRANRISRHMSALSSAAGVATSAPVSSISTLLRSVSTNPARSRAKRCPAKPNCCFSGLSRKSAAKVAAS